MEGGRGEVVGVGGRRQGKRGSSLYGVGRVCAGMRECVVSASHQSPRNAHGGGVLFNRGAATANAQRPHGCPKRDGSDRLISHIPKNTRAGHVRGQCTFSGAHATLTCGEGHDTPPADL